MSLMSLMTPAAKTALDRDGWTIDDLYEIPDDGLRYELLDGMLLVSPPSWATTTVRSSSGCS